jgi:hypothetical protein
VQLSALPMSHAMLSPERWWQHHRFRRHVGERLCSACGCARGGWCRRLRRGHRAKLVIGESESRLAGSVAQRSLVFVAERSASCSATCVATRSTRREPTPMLDVSWRWFVRGCGRQGDPSGFSWCIARSVCVAMRNQSARSTFRWYQESLVWQGRWGSSRGGNVAAGFQPNLTSAVHSGLRIRGDGSSLPLTSRRHRRATAGGVGVSNR